MAAGMSRDADPSKLCDRLGTRWALAETSFKYHASCRHTHPAADALQQALREHGLSPDDIERVVTHVHQGAIDVLGPVTDPRTVHQSKFSMGTVLALVALQGRAGLAEFDAGLDDERVAAFRQRVVMELDPEVDAAYPSAGSAGHGPYPRRAPAAQPRGRQGRSRQHAVPRRDRRQDAAPGTLRRRRHGRRTAHADRHGVERERRRPWEQLLG